MTGLPPCPQCSSAYAYEDRGLLVCPECGKEWSRAGAPAGADEAPAGKVWKDQNGNPLHDGDSVVVVKDLKVRGGGIVKVGTKVRNIRLVDGDHDIDCRIDGFGAMGLKSEFVRKVQ